MTESGGSLQETIALPAIGLGLRFGRQALPHQALNLCATDSAHQSPGAKPGLFGRGFPGNHHLGLAGGTAEPPRFAEIPGQKS